MHCPFRCDFTRIAQIFGKSSKATEHGIDEIQILMAHLEDKCLEWKLTEKEIHDTLLADKKCLKDVLKKTIQYISWKIP